MTQPEHPDLLQTIADAINQLAAQHQSRPEQRLPATVTPEHVSIPGQRTWYGVETLNQKVNGADFSACIAHVTQAEAVYPWLFLVCRLPGEQTWQPFASQGGQRQGSVQPFLGKLKGPRSFVCVGGLEVIPDGGKIRIELPDGSVHEDQARAGCCIVLAPVTYPPDIGEPATVRYLDPDGNELRSEFM